MTSNVLHLLRSLLLSNVSRHSNSRDDLERLASPDISRRTACHGGIISRDWQLLLNSGANVSVTDNEAWTSIHAPARSGYREIVELLLDLAQISMFEIRNNIHRCIAFLLRKQQLNQILQQALQDLGGAALRYHDRDQACGDAFPSILHTRR